MFISKQGNGILVDDYVTELKTLEEHKAFVAGPPGQKLLKVWGGASCARGQLRATQLALTVAARATPQVVMVGTTCTPCIKAFPALLALARSFSAANAHITDFARLMVDDSPSAARDLAALRVLEVPTFLFYM